MAGNLSVMMNIQSFSLVVHKNHLSMESFCFVLLLVAPQLNMSDTLKHWF